jgi:hypothetical protein
LGALVFITAAFIALGSIAVAFIAAGFIVVQPYVVEWPWGSELLLLVLLPPELIVRHAVDIIPIHRATRTATHELCRLEKIFPPVCRDCAIGFTGIHRMIADPCETHRRFEAAFTIP